MLECSDMPIVMIIRVSEGASFVFSLHSKISRALASMHLQFKHISHTHNVTWPLLHRTCSREMKLVITTKRKPNSHKNGCRCLSLVEDIFPVDLHCPQTLVNSLCCSWRISSYNKLNTDLIYLIKC